MSTNNKEKEKLIDDVINRIEKEHGKGSIRKMNDNSSFNIKVNSSGSLLLDRALGTGGYPIGRIVEIYGPESSGKTTLTLQAIAEVQKAGGRAAFIDAEHAIDPTFAKRLGVDLDALLLSQPDSGEQAMEIVEMLVNSNSLDLIVIDSVAALVPEIELKGEISDQTIGAHARLMSKALRRLTGVISKTDTTVIFINQIREKVGVMFGSPEITTGGRALKFYSSIRIDVRVRERIREDNRNVAQIMKIKVVKNKLAEPYREAEVELRYETGFNKDKELVDLATDYDIIKKAGAWYSYKDQKIGQGRESVYEWFKQNKKEHKEIETQVIDKLSKI